MRWSIHNIRLYVSSSIILLLITQPHIHHLETLEDLGPGLGILDVTRLLQHEGWLVAMTSLHDRGRVYAIPLAHYSPLLYFPLSQTAARVPGPASGPGDHSSWPLLGGQTPLRGMSIPASRMSLSAGMCSSQCLGLTMVASQPQKLGGGHLGVSGSDQIAIGLEPGAARRGTD